jgi:hypothetical protein
MMHELILAKILDGADIPNSNKGVYFVEAGHNSFIQPSRINAGAGV